jgi:proteasome accessory factor B
VAYDHARHDKRVFAVDNVSDVHVTVRTFTKPNDFNVDAFAADSISGVMHGAVATPVRVRFAPRVAKAAVAARVVAERQIERLDDGSVEIEYRVSDADELARWVLGWGAQAEVLGPPDVRNRVAVLSKEIAEKYTRQSDERVLV